MKRIAFITQSLEGGGQERVTATLVNGLCEKDDYKVYLITGKASENEYSVNDKVTRIPVFNGNLVKDVISLRAVLNKKRIDVAVAMGIYANFVGCMSNIFQKTKIIISERNDPVHDRLSNKSKIFRFLFYRFADGYVFQTEQARSFYSKSIQRKGVIIPNPLKEGIPYKSDVCNKEIVAVGRLMPQKNYPNLIKAFSIVSKKHPDYILRIFGKGECENDLKMLCKKLNVADKVIFEGFCNNVHEQIKDSQIFVMSSDFEGMPNALMEAMAMGFPVVSTDCPCGGPASLIRNNENGILVEVNNYNDLASAICKLIDNSEFRKHLAVHAQTLKEKYSISLIMDKWRTLIG